MYIIIWLVNTLSNSQPLSLFFNNQRGVTMFQIAICEDEKIYSDKIKLFINEFDSMFDIDVFSTGKSLLDSNKNYDIIFMDVELPDANGITLLKSNPLNSIIIILTSHTEEAIRGYHVNAFRFLTKPIDHVLFHEAILSAINILKKDIHIKVLDNKSNLKKISVKNIVYAEAGDRKTGIRTINDFFYVKKPIGQIEAILSSNFYFVHRSYIVNMNYIERLDLKNRNIIMQEESVIPVSRLKWHDFKCSFFQYLRESSR